MTARDKWVNVSAKGVITLLSENDGWTFMNRGPEREEEVVTLDQLDGHLLRDAIEGLKRNGFVVPTGK